MALSLEQVLPMLERNRPLPLVQSEFVPQVDPAELLSPQARQWFQGARSPAGALAGVALGLQCWEAAHEIAQDLPTVEGSYWHGILHRLEPDAFNAAYWFRRLGAHPVFTSLRAQAVVLVGEEWDVPDPWDASKFVRWVEEARANSLPEKLVAAQAIQQAEWQLLFDYCRA